MKPIEIKASISGPTQRRICAVLCGILGVIQLAYYFKMRTFWSVDTETYLKWSDVLLEANFDVATWVHRTSEWGGGHSILYTSFVGLISLLRKIFDEHWYRALVFMNITATSALPFLIYQTGSQCLKDGPIALLSALALLFAFDVWQFSRYLLTDSIALFLSTFLFMLGMRRVFSTQKRLNPAWVVSGILGLLIFLFFRPTSIFILPWLALVWLIRNDSIASIAAKARRRTAFISLLFLAVVLVAGWVLAERDLFLQSPLQKLVRFVWAFYERGAVVDGRLETFHAKPETYFDIVSISFDRIYHFFFVVPDAWSRGHKVLFRLFFFPLYLTSGLTLLKFTFNRASADHMATIFLIIAFVLTFTLPVTFFVVDFDWRYRLPIVPALVLLSFTGLHSLVVRCKTLT